MTETSLYPHLKLWKLPSSYAGAEWPDYYVVLGQHRDSDSITRSNFTVAHKELEAIAAKYKDGRPVCKACNGTGKTDNYFLYKDYNTKQCAVCGGDGTFPFLVNPYENHWAVGHCEWLGVHKDSPAELLEAADRMVGDIEDYPILDESHHSELEWNEANEYWDREPVKYRVDWLKRCAPRIPCFAARHDLSTIMHQYDSKADRLWESLTSN